MEEQPKIRLTDEEWAELTRPAEKAELYQPHENIAHRAKRRTLRDCFRAAIDALTASLRLTATEAEHHISRIEAAAVDSFQTEMSKMCSTPEGRQRLRDTAIALGQLGVSGFEDVQKMVQGYYVMKNHGLTITHLLALAELKWSIDNLTGGTR